MRRILVRVGSKIGADSRFRDIKLIIECLLAGFLWQTKSIVLVEEW